MPQDLITGATAMLLDDIVATRDHIGDSRPLAIAARQRILAPLRMETTEEVGLPEGVFTARPGNAKPAVLPSVAAALLPARQPRRPWKATFDSPQG